MSRYEKQQADIAAIKDFIRRYSNGTPKQAQQAQSRQKLLAKMIEAGLEQKVCERHVGGVVKSQCLLCPLVFICRCMRWWLLLVVRSSAPRCPAFVSQVERDPVIAMAFADPGLIPPPVLQLTGVSFGYPGSRMLYENLEFGLDLDSRITLVGPNGQGRCCWDAPAV
jgi:ATP-binding cassette, subfamily F, member 2